MGRIIGKALMDLGARIAGGIIYWSKENPDKWGGLPQALSLRA